MEKNKKKKNIETEVAVAAASEFHKRKPSQAVGGTGSGEPAAPPVCVRSAAEDGTRKHVAIGPDEGGAARKRGRFDAGADVELLKAVALRTNPHQTWSGVQELGCELEGLLESGDLGPALCRAMRAMLAGEGTAAATDRIRM